MTIAGPADSNHRPHLAVVGGGVTGLAAALRLRDLLPHAPVTVLEAADHVGGKIATCTLDNIPIELGAEMMHISHPAIAPLVHKFALPLIHPVTTRAAVYSNGTVTPIPDNTFFGIPLTGESHVPVTANHLPERDVTVGEVARAELGDTAVDTLIDPLVGGVYAGSADDLSLQSTVPQLASALRQQGSLVSAARTVKAGNTTGRQYAAVRGGMGQFIHVLREECAAQNITVHTRWPVGKMKKMRHRWQLFGAGAGERQSMIAADSVVFATPAYVAGRLLADAAPSASVLLGSIEYASIGLVTLVVRGAALPQVSGVLVAATEGLAMKAMTCVSTKWPGYGDVAVVRASIGRARESAALELSDEKLVRQVHREINTILACMDSAVLPTPDMSHVTRWRQAMPQYTAGHQRRVQDIRQALPAGVCVAGAAYDGVGIPACITSGHTAATTLAQHHHMRGNSG